MPKTIKTRSGRVLELPSDEEDAAINAGIAADPDNPELGEEWFKQARPAQEVLPPEVHEGLVALKRRPGQRGPQKAPRKLAVTVRYDAEVVEAFRAGGEGWQTRMNDALRDWLRTHPQK
jgi:uncharacterized protein (DUF4415 family)